MGRGRALLLTAAVAVGALTVHEAVAGNISAAITDATGIGPVQSYFSVMLTAGQTLSWNANITTTTTEVMLIDDITYSVNLDPWVGPSNRSAVFSWNDLQGVEEWFGTLNPNPFIPPPWTHPNLLFQNGFLFGGLITWDVETWDYARGDYFALEMQNVLSATVTRPFDRISHCSNIQMIGREVWFNDTSINTALGVTMSATQAVVQTSESRHYQTPHWVVPGSTVTPNFVSTSAYLGANVYVKGRIVTSPLTVPPYNQVLINGTAAP